MSDTNKPVEQMTGEEFEAARQEQNDHLRKQLAALDAGPRARLRRFTDLEVVCKRCGEPIFTVVATQPYRVIRTRGTGEDYLPPDTPTVEEVRARLDAEGVSGVARGEAIYEAVRPPGHKENIRRSDGRFYPLAWPPPPDPTTLGSHIQGVCGCRTVSYRLSQIYDALLAGTRRVVLEWRGDSR